MRTHSRDTGQGERSPVPRPWRSFLLEAQLRLQRVVSLRTNLLDEKTPAGALRFAVVGALWMLSRGGSKVQARSEKGGAGAGASTGTGTVGCLLMFSTANALD